MPPANKSMPPQNFRMFVGYALPGNVDPYNLNEEIYSLFGYVVWVRCLMYHILYKLYCVQMDSTALINRHLILIDQTY